MAEYRDRSGKLFLRHEYGELQLIIPPNPLLPDGYDLRKGKLLVTEWGGILPPVDFSEELFKLVTVMSETQEQEAYRKDASLLSKYLLKRERVTPMSFDTEMGCWDMELLGGPVDDRGRARYPAGSIRELGYCGGRTGMHQITYEVFRGEKIPIVETSHAKRIRRTDVDHLCREHECCNPFHLQPVDPAENTIRGNTARRAIAQPHMHMMPAGEWDYAEILSHIEEYGLGVRSLQRRIERRTGRSEEQTEQHPTLF